jgi:small basic protein
MGLSVKLHLYVSGFVPWSIVLSLVAYGFDEITYGHAFMLAAAVIVFGMRLLDYSIRRSVRKLKT